MEIREEIVTEVRKYLVGPHSEEEELPPLPNYPLDFYISGVLFPINTELQTEDKELLAADAYKDSDEDTNGDTDFNTGWLKQNSIGIRCGVKAHVRKVLLDVGYGMYSLTENNKWKRRPVHSTKDSFLAISLDDKKGFFEIKNEEGLVESRITWKIDESKSDDHQFRVLTVFLSNEMQAPDSEDESGKKIGFKKRIILENKRCIFQPFIKIIGVDDESPFRPSQAEQDIAFENVEDQILELLFRNNKIYAQGYNCGAAWEESNNPHYVYTEIMPSYSTHNISMYSDTDGNRPHLIDMVSLAYAKTPDEMEHILRPMISLYEKWIESLSQKIALLKVEQPEFVDIAKENQERCKIMLHRMREGLSLIIDGKNPEIFDAFVLANRAMLYQRVHYEFAIGKSKGKKQRSRCPDPSQPAVNFWRPFQIAFMLLNTKGISDKKSQDRKIVDLLWFPTGGGKTEAYLGLAAFAILLRRIRGVMDGSGGSGVTVIMRYTLRLLTLQQFERAASLMCALEMFRRNEKKKLGTEPFLLGLWVGWSLTPNSAKASEEALRKKAKDEDPQTGSADQLVFCPWCGAEITWRNFVVDDRTKWTISHCSDNDCEFYHPNAFDTTKALPVVTVDTDIYHRCPSLLIGTVDKFARMPWRPDSASIFGWVDRYCQTHGFLTQSEKHETRHNKEKVVVEPIQRLDGPDLIIQDELHLVSGPVGTMVGLYETAVEYLSSRKTGEYTIKPKIIVSSATVRGVDHQIRKLFNRDSPQKFPPPGIDYGDTFFWWEEISAGRQYVGVSFSNYSMKFALARLYASLLQRVYELKESGVKMIDPYWTLVGYFNSIRELGGAIRLVEDDTKSNINAIVNLINGHKKFRVREIKPPAELTGRINGQGIRRIRQVLERSSDSPESIDVLLATNMISVGIDIDRLGLMVVAGQPKNSTEYIQVSGRIGRRKDILGLVFTLYNPYKPRDLSHYENFVGYHSRLQKSVEPVSLTPFSDRALERALHAVFIALVRLTITNMSKKEDANNLRLAKRQVQKLREVILDRYVEVQEVDRSKPEFIALERKLKDFEDNWDRYIEQSRKDGNNFGVWYHNPFDPYDVDERKNPTVLMIDFADRQADHRQKKFPLATPGSMRDVEKEAGLYYQ